MSEWPEPVREPGETPRWLGWTVAALLFGALLWAVRDDNALRMPEFALPEIEMPEIQWPDFAENAPTNDVSVAPTTSADNLGDASPVVEGPSSDFEMPVVEGASFEMCVGAIDQAAATLGPATVIENSADRRVVRFKTLQGDLTMSCIDGTMRMEQRGG